eukprot:6206044-Pleurochrysis_carterae.AAC.4
MYCTGIRTESCTQASRRASPGAYTHQFHMLNASSKLYQRQPRRRWRVSTPPHRHRPHTALAPPSLHRLRWRQASAGPWRLLLPAVLTAAHRFTRGEDFVNEQRRRTRRRKLCLRDRCLCQGHRRDWQGLFGHQRQQRVGFDAGDI